MRLNATPFFLEWLRAASVAAFFVYFSFGQQKLKNYCPVIFLLPANSLFRRKKTLTKKNNYSKPTI